MAAATGGGRVGGWVAAMRLGHFGGTGEKRHAEILHWTSSCLGQQFRKHIVPGFRSSQHTSGCTRVATSFPPNPAPLCPQLYPEENPDLPQLLRVIPADSEVRTGAYVCVRWEGADLATGRVEYYWSLGTTTGRSVTVYGRAVWQWCRCDLALGAQTSPRC